MTGRLPLVASAPSPTSMSSMTSSVGGASFGMVMLGFVRCVMGGTIRDRSGLTHRVVPMECAHHQNRR